MESWTRRRFLYGAGVGMAAFVAPTPLARAARAASGSDPVLVALYLRGGADGLNLVIPQGDPAYAQIRPNLGVPPAAQLPLTGFFGLNPALAALMPCWQSRDLAFVHAAGSPDPTRSHFDAQDFMETGAPGDKGRRDGWLARYLGLLASGEALSGITLAGSRARSMIGTAPSLAFSRIDDFALTGSLPEERRVALESRYALEPLSLLGQSVGDAFAALEVIEAIEASADAPYPASTLGAALRDAAALIRADVGVRVIAVNRGGWDHHVNETPRMNGVAADVADSLAAFQEDLGADADRTLTLAMTEFGRRAAENAEASTEHGHGSVMLALGGPVDGGRVLLRDGRWPGLAPADLFRGQDLAVTTDFRDVFAEILVRHMRLADADPVFPDFTPSPSDFPGLVA